MFSNLVLLCVAPYIDGGGGQITLCEIILEFRSITLVEVEKTDIGKGAVRYKAVQPLKGKPVSDGPKHQVTWEGAIPASLKDLQPGRRAIFFTDCFDRRSLTFVDGLWYWTQPIADGWESGPVRKDFDNVFVGKATELAEAIKKLLRGQEVSVRCQGRATEWVRYSMKNPNVKALARDPAAPPAKNRPLAAWITELKDPNPSIRMHAGLALGELGPAARGAEAALTEALKDKDDQVRYAAVLALGALGAQEKAAIDGLAKALQDPNWFVRFTATLVFQKLGPRAKSAVPALVQALRPNDGVKDFRPIRCGAAAVALSRIDPKAPGLDEAISLVVQKLLEYHGLGSDGARVVGATMLGDCGSVALAAAPALEKRLKDEDGDVRVAAALALIKIAPEKYFDPALSTLLAELNNADVLVRVLAADALAALGPRAKSALPALKEMSKDPDSEVRLAVAQAIRAIGSK